MSTYTVSGEEALRNLQENACGRWHHKNARADDAQGTLAFQRLRTPFFTPLIRPEFKVSRSDQLFAIGSCFARGIEAALLGQKLQVLSAAPEFSSFQTIGPQVTGLGFTNKYNTFSIANELRWALDPAAHFPEQSVIHLRSGLAYDPHINPTLQPAHREETLRRRAIVRQVNARVAQCRVVIITLGLIEVWRDRVTDVFINSTPPPEAIARYPERYEFHVSSFSENLDNLNKVAELLNRYGHPDVHVLVTVSPVPLMATFTRNDIIVANTYSKSLLRTVAQEWAAAQKNVHYFPSYEIVMNSARDAAWIEDLRHVRGPLVQHIMGLFLKNYLEEPASVALAAAE